MNINVKATGVESTINKLTIAGVKAKTASDRVAETYARKMANESADNAPVKSGDLRANLASSPHRISAGVWQFGGTLAYTRRQEYEHPSRKGFIRKAVWGNRNDYREALRREVSKWT